MKTAVIIPAYNEEITIKQVIEDVNKALNDAEIWVFDNNSTDKTASIVKELLNEKRLNLHLRSVKRQGKGAVVREAFDIIEADIYVMIDADTQYDATALPGAIEYFKTNELDQLNIAREPESSAVHRRGHGVGNLLFSKFCAWLFSAHIKDLFGGYRIFSKRFVKSFSAFSDGFEIETELTVFALQQKLRFEEIYAPYKARPEGSFSKLSTFKDGFKILKTMFGLLFTERPFLVFGSVAAVCFLVCLVLGAPVLYEYFQTHKVPRFPTLFTVIGFWLFGSMSLIGGLIAHLVSKATKEARRMNSLHYEKDFN